jgi:hypothetical protein
MRPKVTIDTIGIDPSLIVPIYDSRALLRLVRKMRLGISPVWFTSWPVACQLPARGQQRTSGPMGGGRGRLAPAHISLLLHIPVNMETFKRKSVDQ